MQEQPEVQNIPVKVYSSADRLTVAAPMPGLEADDIRIEVTDDGYLVLNGDVRGTLKGQKDLLIDEWTVGGYHRTVALPLPVDAVRANATYGNGVLVISFPMVEKTRGAQIALEQIGSARGEHVGHAGHTLSETTTEEHRAAMTHGHEGDGESASGGA